MAQRLPDDVLADVLRHLAPRYLAASRSVCRAWRDVVDARGLLRADLLPLSLAGLFINFHCLDITELFSRPSTDASICGKHDYFPDAAAGVRSWSFVLHHCNGLLLIAVDNDSDDLRVLNPATRFWTALPKCPAPVMETDLLHDEYLAYDPTVSPHYQVFSIPRFVNRGRIGDFHYDRISLSNDTYQVIKPPRESSCKMEWVLIHQRSLVEWLIKYKLDCRGAYRSKHDPRVSGPWSLQNLNYCYGKYNIEDDVEADMCEEKWEWSSEASVSEKFEWSSDDCNVDQCKNNSYENYRGYYTEILGFHPYKEIIFLSEITTRGLAYNFNSSEVQVLGDIYPLRYRQELLNDQFIMSSFAYTPCLMEM
ncbi:hypothetical protein QOZ80_3BG0270180 [Eleusine coracana subsp. coracana]|nr:hypothetical protein QOZ80_3BG0270180 [Eleusine coracana subsp. coracana]